MPFAHNHQHDKTDPSFGVYDIDYYYGRQKSRALKYRLMRRSQEVYNAITKYSQGDLNIVLDIGTADTLMLEYLKEKMPSTHFIGVDRSLALLKARGENGISKVQSDALQLPFKSEAFDSIIATAVIEHVPDANIFIKESHRTLKKGGIISITTPHPFWENLASIVGHLKEAGHYKTFDTKELKPMLTENGFKVLEDRKFMFSPIGFPKETFIEKVLGPLGLNMLMANQILIACRI